MSPRNAGLVLLTQPVVMALVSPLAGRLSDKVSPRFLASIGMSLTTLGLLMLTIIHEDTGLLLILPTLVVLGLGFAFFSSPNSNAVMSSVERRQYGVASGALGTMRTTGQMLSMGIAMLLFAVYMGQSQITPDVYPQFLLAARTGFVIFAVVCIGGVVASLARGRSGRGDRT